jgi:threonine/homoserine/homoserine lactone efflux protein
MVVTAQQLLVFAAASLVVIAAPGPDNLATLAIGLSKGRRQAMGFGVGCATGCFTHTLWATVGVTALIAASAVAFTCLKVLGALYLFYLGVRSFNSCGPATPNEAHEASSLRKYFLRGFVANAINPKVALFFFVFLPQFVFSDRSAAPQIIAMGTCFAAMTAVAFTGVGYFSSQIGLWLKSRPAMNRRLDRLTGMLFMGLGVRMLL